MKTKRCAICNEKINGFGNNAEPIKNGVCCNKCNVLYVIPQRLKLNSTIEWVEKEINKVFEKTNFSIQEIRKASDTIDNLEIEIYQDNLCGEDLRYTFEISSNIKNNYKSLMEQLKSNVEKVLEEFDADEYVTNWLRAKMEGVSGVPCAYDLINNAQTIQNDLENLINKLNLFIR